MRPADERVDGQQRWHGDNGRDGRSKSRLGDEPSDSDPFQLGTRAGGGLFARLRSQHV